MTAAAPLGIGRLVLYLSLALLLSAAWNGSRVVFSLFAIHLQASAFQVGMLLSLFSLLPMLFAIPSGRFVDRIGPRGPIVWSSVLFTAGLLLPAVLPFLGTLYIAAAGLGLCFLFCQLGLMNSVAAASDASSRTTNLAWVTMGFAAGSSLGPLVIGLAIDIVGHRVSFALCALFPAAIAATVVIRRRLAGDRGKAAAPVQPPPTGRRSIMDLLRIPSLRDTLMIGGVLTAVWDLFGFIVPVRGSEIGLSASAIGAVLAALSAASFAVRAFMTAILRAVTESVLLASMLALAALGYMVFPLFESLTMWVVVATVIGIAIGLAQPVNQARVYAAAPPGRGGEAMGLRLGIGHGLHVVAPTAIGALSTSFGIGPVVWGLCALLYGTAWYTYRRGR